MRFIVGLLTESNSMPMGFLLDAYLLLIGFLFDFYEVSCGNPRWLQYAHCWITPGVVYDSYGIIVVRPVASNGMPAGCLTGFLWVCYRILVRF